MKMFLKCQSTKMPPPLETHEQQKFVSFARYLLKRNGLEKLLFSVPNEGVRDRKSRSRMLCEGMVAGVPDLCLAIPCNGWHGLYIEMKRVKGSKVTEEQKEMICLLKSQGYRVEICKGFDEAKDVFLDYLKNSGLVPKNV